MEPQRWRVFALPVNPTPLVHPSRAFPVGLRKGPEGPGREKQGRLSQADSWEAGAVDSQGRGVEGQVRSVPFSSGRLLPRIHPKPSSSSPQQPAPWLPGALLTSHLFLLRPHSQPVPKPRQTLIQRPADAARNRHPSVISNPTSASSPTQNGFGGAWTTRRIWSY